MRLHLYYKIAFTSLIFLKLELTLSYSLNNWSDFMYTTPVHVLLDPECPNHIGKGLPRSSPDMVLNFHLQYHAKS